MVYKDKKTVLVTEEQSDFKKGLTLQRERFKAGKNGEGTNNYDLMCDSIENLKSDLQSMIKKKSNQGQRILTRIQKIINWYRTLEQRLTKNTPEGRQVIVPQGIHNRINKNLTIAYELLVEQMGILELL